VTETAREAKKGLGEMLDEAKEEWKTREKTLEDKAEGNVEETPERPYSVDYVGYLMPEVTKPADEVVKPAEDSNSYKERMKQNEQFLTEAEHRRRLLKNLGRKG